MSEDGTVADGSPPDDGDASGGRGRDVEVPLPVYKVVTVFSTLIAVVLVVGGFLALDAATGEQIWTQRLDGNYSSSPMYADGKIYLGNHDGDVTVFQPGREFKQLASNALEEPIMASPVAVGGSLIIRTEEALYCFEK